MAGVSEAATLFPNLSVIFGGAGAASGICILILSFGPAGSATVALACASFFLTKLCEMHK